VYWRDFKYNTDTLVIRRDPFLQKKGILALLNNPVADKLLKVSWNGLSYSIFSYDKKSFPDKKKFSGNSHFFRGRVREWRCYQQ
jgi:hypothetical protein